MVPVISLTVFARRRRRTRLVNLPGFVPLFVGNEEIGGGGHVSLAERLGLEDLGTDVVEFDIPDLCGCEDVFGEMAIGSG